MKYIPYILACGLLATSCVSLSGGGSAMSDLPSAAPCEWLQGKWDETVSLSGTNEQISVTGNIGLEPLEISTDFLGNDYSTGGRPQGTAHYASRAWGCLPPCGMVVD